MFDADPAPQPSADETPDPAVLRAERRLRLLEEMTEIGMRLLRRLDPDAPAGESAAQPNDRDPAEAFAPLSRAIRLTLSLEAKTDAELRDLKAGIVREREAVRVRAKARVTANDSEAYADRVRELVLKVAEAECPDTESYGEIWDALEERLDEDEAYVDCAERPLRETIERLCHDLTLAPDWSCWTGEGWSHEYAAQRPRFSPFHRPSAKPVRKGKPAQPQTPVPVQPYQSSHALE